jgi:hydrogenase maturation protease
MKPPITTGRVKPSSTLTRVLVLGVGNRYRGDDAAGLLVADRVREAKVAGLVVRESPPDPMSIIETWSGFDRVIVVDATSSGAKPGKVIHFTSGKKLPRKIFSKQVSSHGVGLGEAIELGRVLDRLPQKLAVYGIEGAAFEVDSKMKSRVRFAVQKTAEYVLQDVEKIRAKEVKGASEKIEIGRSAS